MRVRLLVVATLLICATARGALETAVVQRAFAAFDANCSRDAGRLWGVSLCGKLMIVDKSTRQAIGNDGWSGRLPEPTGIANTAVDFNGARWSMVMWPLPGDDAARDRLLLHERFHAIQRDLGIEMASPSNDHLDSLDGRYLMRLEMRALREAVLALRDGRSAQRAMRDAQNFRAARHAKFSGAAASEAALEMNEGLAEYTAVRLFTTDRRAMLDRVATALAAAEKESGFVRSFAYATGPAWGVLNDEFAPAWRHAVAKRGTIVASGKPSSPLHAARYGGSSLLAEEQKRDKERRGRIASYERRFVAGPVLRLPLVSMQMQFDPHDVHPFDDRGTVYETITITDAWGKIVVTSGALIAGDFRSLTVKAPADGGVTSDAWTLTLAPGWRIAPGPRAGDFAVERVPQ